MVSAIAMMSLWFVVDTGVAAFKALRAVLRPMHPELGDTAFEVMVLVRQTFSWRTPLPPTMYIGADAIEFAQDRDRHGLYGRFVHELIPVDAVGAAWATMLPPFGPQPPWVTLSRGTVLYAEPGPAIVLRTTLGDRPIPVHGDAELIAALIQRRAQRLARMRTSTPNSVVTPG